MHNMVALAGRLRRVGAMRSSSGPAALFTSGAQGAWYDPSDLSTLFQDSAGTMPVTAAGQPVGRMLDKSGRGNHATQVTAAARPTYQASGGLHWLAFDGVDDSMVSPNIAGGVQPNWWFSAASAFTAYTGLTTSFRYFGVYLDTSNHVSLSMRFQAEGTRIAAYALRRSAGTQVLLTSAAGTTLINVPVVAEGFDDGTTVTLRLSSGSDVTGPPVPYSGAGTDLPIIIGSASLAMKFYGGIGRLATPTEVERTTTRQWLAAKSGVTL